MPVPSISEVTGNNHQLLNLPKVTEGLTAEEAQAYKAELEKEYRRAIERAMTRNPALSTTLAQELDALQALPDTGKLDRIQSRSGCHGRIVY